MEACVAQLLQRGLPEEGILRVTPRPPPFPPAALSPNRLGRVAAVGVLCVTDPLQPLGPPHVEARGRSRREQPLRTRPARRGVR